MAILSRPQCVKQKYAFYQSSRSAESGYLSACYCCWCVLLDQLITQFSRWFIDRQCHLATNGGFSHIIRLLDSPNLVVMGRLSVGYKTMPPIGWHHPFVIGWYKYKLGLPRTPLYYGLTWPVGIPTIFQPPVTVHLVLCKGTVKESTTSSVISHRQPFGVI